MEKEKIEKEREMSRNQRLSRMERRKQANKVCKDIIAKVVGSLEIAVVSGWSFDLFSEVILRDMILQGEVNVIQNRAEQDILDLMHVDVLVTLLVGKIPIANVLFFPFFKIFICKILILSCFQAIHLKIHPSSRYSRTDCGKQM